MALAHENLSGYLEDDYLSGPYLGGTLGAHLPAQFEVKILDFNRVTNAQFESQILESNKITGAQFIKTGIVHRICQGYLEGGYLEDPYLTEILCASLHGQFEAVIKPETTTNAQFDVSIIDNLRLLNSQFESKIVDFEKPIGAQMNVSIVQRLGAQFTALLYNTTQTRILCDFLSRGLAVAQGGSGGQNWTAKIGAIDITAPGDFSANNLNTDIVEQRWQSTNGSVSNVNLDVDTEIAQGVTIDTLAILDHNFSAGATLVLQGSNDSGFGTINTTITLPVAETNIFYLSPNFPTSVDQNRYWRLNINDPLNTDNNLRVGTIIFGNAVILSTASCMTDRIRRTEKHFADRVRTEGFTTVSNDRALKRRIEMRFQDLQFGVGDFEKLEEIFGTARTSLKCLWIPYPQVARRFGTFGKIVVLPQEEHNVKSLTDSTLDLISFNLSVDESK